MVGKVFISYRRDDSAGHAGRVHDRLEQAFGRDLLFMDVDAIPLGMNFIKILREEVAKCDVLLAVIGPHWIEASDKQGNRRLDDPHDYVRVEIAAALQRDIPVIPVLLDGAEIPKVDELPTDLEELALRNGLYVRHASFHSDMERLIAGLEIPLGQGDAPIAPVRRPSTQERARLATAERRAAAAASEAGQGTPAGASWLRPAAIGFGGALVLAAAIVAVVVVRKPPLSSSPPPAPIQQLPQSAQQPPVVAPSTRQAAQPAAAPAPSLPPAIAPPAETVQPAPQTAQVPAAPAPAPPQVAQQPPAQTQPASPAVQPPSPAVHTALKTAEPPFVPLTSSRERTLQPGDSFKECDNCPEMVIVPAGAFTMGSPDSEQGRSADESPQHVVTIGKPFAAGKFEVTVDQFAAFVKDTTYDTGAKCLTLEDGKSGIKDGRSWRDPGYPQTGSHPVACLDWNDAKAYLGWLSKKTGKDYRLLTEAEWEYAARATTAPGSGSRYTFGDDDSAMCRYGNVADKTARQSIPGAAAWTIYPCSDGYAYAAPVGTFTANAFGLYDVHGNVWEWTEDCYNASYNGAPADGAPWLAGDCNRRMARGGMWGSNPASVRLARRLRIPDDTRSQDIGFRVARTVER